MSGLKETLDMHQSKSEIEERQQSDGDQIGEKERTASAKTVTLDQNPQIDEAEEDPKEMEPENNTENKEQDKMDDTNEQAVDDSEDVKRDHGEIPKKEEDTPVRSNTQSKGSGPRKLSKSMNYESKYHRKPSVARKGDKKLERYDSRRSVVSKKSSDTVDRQLRKSEGEMKGLTPSDSLDIKGYQFNDDNERYALIQDNDEWEIAEEGNVRAMS